MSKLVVNAIRTGWHTIINDTEPASDRNIKSKNLKFQYRTERVFRSFLPIIWTGACNVPPKYLKYCSSRRARQ